LTRGSCDSCCTQDSIRLYDGDNNNNDADDNEDDQDNDGTFYLQGCVILANNNDNSKAGWPAVKEYRTGESASKAEDGKKE